MKLKEKRNLEDHKIEKVRVKRKFPVESTKQSQECRMLKPGIKGAVNKAVVTERAPL